MLETFELNDARGKEPEGSRLTELESISVNMRRRPGASANSIYRRPRSLNAHYNRRDMEI